MPDWLDRLPIPTLETPRLRLRPWREGTWRNIALIVGHWALRGYGAWVVEEKASGAFLGRVGLWRPEGCRASKSGGRCWALLGPRLCLRGRASLVEDAFTSLEEKHVISLIYRDNQRSIRVAERIGERFERTIFRFKRECLIYGVEKALVPGSS